MQIFSIIALMELSNVVTLLKSQSLFFKHEVLQKRAKAFYQHLSNGTFDNADCYLNPAQAVSWRKNDESWWQQHACSYEPNFYWFIEKLQIDPCVYLIKTETNQLFTVQYYRVTLAIFHQNGFALFQQSTYAEPAQTVLICQDDAKHFAILGRQMVHDV